MTQKEQILGYLESEPKFRERKNKNRGIVNVLITKHKELLNVKKETLISMVSDFVSMDRQWRQILEKERPDLRGTDYDEKYTLEQEAQIKLGYAPGYGQDVKKLSTL